LTRKARALAVRATRIAASLAAALVAGCGGSEGGGAASQRAAGHERMLALLREIAARTDEDHFFLGDALARRLRAGEKEVQSGGDPRERWKIEHQLGVVELRLGNVREAIDHFTHAYRLLPAARLDLEWEARTRFDLAMAWLRLGEVENCCARTTAESCILPIAGGGRHQQAEGSRQAIQYFLEAIRVAPDNKRHQHTCRWLLNIAYMTLGGYPGGVPPEYLIPPARFESPRPFPRFANIAARLGLDTVNLSGGAIADDFDGDGYLDLLTSTWDTRGPMRFFRNAGDGTFADRTREAGLDGLLGGLNMKQADYDNDGDLDVLVLRGAWLGDKGRHPNSLLENDGSGRFTDVTFAAGLGGVHYPTQTADWADYDNDGDLDLYVGNESSEKLRAPCQLFESQGDRTFRDVAAAAGVENFRFAKGVAWGDYDGDRFPDLYVSNLKGPNRLYKNRGDGTFTDVAPELGVTEPDASFPVWFWDFDNDGALDLYVASYEGRTDAVAAYHLGETVSEGLPRLYQGDGKGRFRDVTRAQGLEHPVLVMGSNFGDVDSDGFLDFYLGTGDPDFSSLLPNLLFVNRGGSGFDNVTYAAGVGHLQKGHAVSFADFDHDGDLDVFEQMGGAFRGDPFADALYENPGFGTRWIAVELRGVESNRCAIGARIRVDVREAGKLRSIYRQVTSGGSFGANPLRQTIGLGKADAIERLEVFWPRTGKTQLVEGVALDRAIRVVEGKQGFTEIALRPLRLGGGNRPAADSARGEARAR
jgi:tetratricopeptide (TPR) repeat protein